MKIHVVDDDPVQLALATAALESIGHRDVLVSECPETMLSHFAADGCAADVYFLDIMMPAVDGIEMCRHLRGSKKAAHANIIMMTALADRIHIDRAFNAGADDYIMKPFDPSEIAHRLNSVRKRMDEVPGLAPGGTGLFLGRDLDFARACNLTQPVALEAYVKALDRGRASLSMATAYRVMEWSKHTASATEVEEVALVGAIADTLKDGLSATSFVLSYFGEGVFLCVTRRADPVVSASLLRRLNAAIQDLCGGEVLSARYDGVIQSSDQIALIRQTLEAARSLDQKRSAPTAARRDAIPDLFSC